MSVGAGRQPLSKDAISGNGLSAQYARLWESLCRRVQRYLNLSAVGHWSTCGRFGARELAKPSDKPDHGLDQAMKSSGMGYQFALVAHPPRPLVRLGQRQGTNHGWEHGDARCGLLPGGPGTACCWSRGWTLRPLLLLGRSLLGTTVSGLSGVPVTRLGRSNAGGAGVRRRLGGDYGGWKQL